MYSLSIVPLTTNQIFRYYGRCTVNYPVAQAPLTFVAEKLSLEDSQTFADADFGCLTINLDLTICD